MKASPAPVRVVSGRIDPPPTTREILRTTGRVMGGMVIGAALFWLGWYAHAGQSPALSPASGSTPVPLHADGTAVYVPRDLLCVAVLDAPKTAQQTVWDAEGKVVVRRSVPMDAPISVLFDF